MSSFLNADLGSDSSEDDEDFNPEKEVNDVSEEEHSGDEEHVEEGGLKKKKRKKREQGWNMRLPVNDNAKEEEKIKEAFEKEKEDLKAEAEKQKTEDLWSGNLFIKIQPKEGFLEHCPLFLLVSRVCQALFHQNFFLA